MIRLQKCQLHFFEKNLALNHNNDIEVNWNDYIKGKLQSCLEEI